ncbi:MAG: SDR family oxidoreductase [Nigerium sp.]|nr:SDR family oxidoreductase [Nigerium sp.]
MQNLRGRVAVVTGTTSGIGRAIATQFVQAGVHVYGVARRDLTTDDLVGSSPEGDVGTYTHIVGDVVQPDTARNAIGRALAERGAVDILVNNAGAGEYSDFLDSDVAFYDEMMGVNMRSTYLFTREVVPSMIDRSRGLILQVASQAGLRGFAREAVYCASKHAQVGFTRALRLELAPHGIKVAVLCPAAVKTDFARGRGRPYEKMGDAEFLTADDIADAVLFVAGQNPGARASEISLIALGESL